MSAGKNSHNTIEVLLVRLMENDLSDQEIECLNRWLKEDPKAVEKYCSFLRDYAIIQSLVKGQIDREDTGLEDSEFDKALWKALSEFEKNAPKIEVAAPVDIPHAPVGKRMTEVPIAHSRLNRSHLFTVLVSAAAILFFVIFIQVTTPDPSVEVATLLDMVDVRWADSTMSLQKGERLLTGHEPLSLSKGIIQIETDRGVTLTIEGPAEFEFTKEADLSLPYGRMYASVSQQGIGFSVSTSHSKVVDLGTEFGIEADLDETELHVVKGRTVLIAGAADRSKKQSEIHQGQARRVTREGTVQDIDLKEDVFARQIDSQDHFIWRGQDINLADIVGGGNGFGADPAGTCIDPATGHVGPYGSMPNRNGQDNYNQIQSFLRKVEDLPGVDCVIVPSQEGGVLPITTTGLTISDFPELLGGTRWLIQTRTHNENYPFVLNGTTYGVNGRSAISMHATCGITFDLNKIRESVPGIDFVSFKTLCGLNESRLAGNVNPEMTAEVYVFLDGTQVYRHVFAHVQNNAVPIEIDLQKNNPRFMTLVVSCGRDDNKLDWFVFGEPILVVQ